MESAEPACVLLCRNSKKKRTRGRRSGWSSRERGENGRKSESGRESDVTARGRRSEKGNGRGRERENGRGTKTATAGPETERETGSGSESGSRTEAMTGAPSAADPGEGKNQRATYDCQSQLTCQQKMSPITRLLRLDSF